MVGESRVLTGDMPEGCVWKKSDVSLTWPGNWRPRVRKWRHRHRCRHLQYQETIMSYDERVVVVVAPFAVEVQRWPQLVQAAA